jgi:hypothetical protein
MLKQESLNASMEALKLSESMSTNLTGDGGIVKIPLKPPTSTKELDWVRGANAKFHYTVHAYIIDAPKKPATDSHAHTHNGKKCTSHKHSSSDECSSDTHKNSPNVESFKTIIDAIADKKPLPKEMFATQDHPSKSNPDLKPTRKKISDSRDGDPFDLRIGYSFSVKALEICVKSMKIGETSRFLCMPAYCEVPQLNPGLRAAGDCIAAKQTQQGPSRLWQTAR